MIADAKLNHRLSWWACAPILALAAALPCFPARGDAERPKAAQPSDAGADENLVQKESRLLKLEDPSGSAYYVEMKGFEGRILEIWFKNGSGVVLDAYPAVNDDSYDVIPLTFGMVTGGPFGRFPDWIRAYRFDPDAKEFDGSWYTFSIDTESGRVVVREVVDAALAAEIRRKAAGIPVLLPHDAKVWRILDHDALQRPSKQQRRTKGDEKRQNAKEGPADPTDSVSPGSDADGQPDLQGIEDSDALDELLSAEWGASKLARSTLREAYASFFRHVHLDLLRVIPPTGKLDDFVASDGTTRAATIQSMLQRATQEKLLTEQQQRTAQDVIVRMLLDLDE